MTYRQLQPFFDIHVSALLSFQGTYDLRNWRSVLFLCSVRPCFSICVVLKGPSALAMSQEAKEWASQKQLVND